MGCAHINLLPHCSYLRPVSSQLVRSLRVQHSSLSAIQAHLKLKLLKARAWKGLGEGVCKIVFCGTVG